ncbi:hypothetical protein RRG08_030002 [Elysia crispata]|uniref:Uncharacterized protein n=1 Tax=Elysia crispata TaxID=231223 RepID=A0AAE0XY98_9GAST|nr:hypothetical protein RRG08_030002 [Elysia crispata]
MSSTTKPCPNRDINLYHNIPDTWLKRGEATDVLRATTGAAAAAWPSSLLAPVRAIHTDLFREAVEEVHNCLPSGCFQLVVLRNVVPVKTSTPVGFNSRLLTSPGFRYGSEQADASTFGPTGISGHCILGKILRDL